MFFSIKRLYNWFIKKAENSEKCLKAKLISFEISRLNFPPSQEAIYSFIARKTPSTEMKIACAT